MTRYWIAVACYEHVRIGREGGFMQVCHGKAAPLKRLREGDIVAYYSPTERLGEKSPCQSFTSIGRVAGGEPYQVHMFDEFYPYRRDVVWFDAQVAPIRPLLARLEFACVNVTGGRNWGYQLRFGLFDVSERDMRTIASAMSAREQDRTLPA
ncbi:EVE domain-containing protein [Budvicia aquatica]|uniref:EVE domain-containing protein n=1 Tax=Budvicia aquatica TaxID=82979 RepID=UPI00208CC70E|nr:EVE domain-containing protein [Budvicia aquatica]GKX53848.1 UPF0310 protein [Budvicia aquatica]